MAMNIDELLLSHTHKFKLGRIGQVIIEVLHVCTNQVGLTNNFGSHFQTGSVHGPIICGPRLIPRRNLSTSTLPAAT
jgi:hypothetical protein